jgi:flagellar motor switch protein FliN/FliY
MIIENVCESEIMQLLPISFSKTLAEKMLNSHVSINNTIKEDKSPSVSNNGTSTQDTRKATNDNAQQNNQKVNYKENEKQNYNDNNRSQHVENTGGSYGGNLREPINVQSATFQNFDESKVYLDKKNVDVIMDIPLQVTVELGRTNRLIRDILEFGSGTIIELDKLAGEHVDILVNGKIIAKGEVVVIDESFGVRITEIIQPFMRI